MYYPERFIAGARDRSQISSISGRMPHNHQATALFFPARSFTARGLFFYHQKIPEQSGKSRICSSDEAPGCNRRNIGQYHLHDKAKQHRIKDCIRGPLRRWKSFIHPRSTEFMWFTYLHGPAGYAPGYHPEPNGLLSLLPR
jgi:hypothetical protein